MDRRKFVKILGAGAAATTIPWRFDLKRACGETRPKPLLRARGSRSSTEPPPGRDGPTGIPVAAPDGASRGHRR